MNVYTSLLSILKTLRYKIKIQYSSNVKKNKIILFETIYNQQMKFELNSNRDCY